MGILTRRQGVQYVVTSDLTGVEPSTRRAPARLSSVYLVWTGAGWSANLDEALNFASIDDADEYVRANYEQLSRKRSDVNDSPPAA